MKNEKKKTDNFYESKNILRVTTKKKKKKKRKDRKDYSNELNHDVICIVGKQNHISSTEFHFIIRSN